jgi:glycosyltransferase involved in cell wall biosynthesis
LKKATIPFHHEQLTDYNKIAKYYHALDLYLVCSRIEGGPLALLECMATGVPVVTTDVGMVEDIIINGKNGFIAAPGSGPGEIAKLAQIVIEQMSEKERREKYISDTAAEVKQYSWDRIAKQFYDNIYSKLIT